MSNDQSRMGTTMTTNSLGPLPHKKKACLTFGCMALGGLMILLLLYVTLWFAFSPSPWKTKIGKAEIPGIGVMEVGHAHDGDITYNYYVRIKDSVGRYSDWTYFGWTVDFNDIPDRCQSARSRDGQFTFIYADKELHTSHLSTIDSMPFMVIHDRKTGLIWPTMSSEPKWTGYWLGAWRAIRMDHPAIPKPPP